MSALDVLNEARAVGVDIAVDGSDLVLAAARRPPHHVIEALSCHKAEIIALLREGDDGCTAEEWRAFFNERVDIAKLNGARSREQGEAMAFACCIVEWMNRHPELSDTGHCAWCGRQDFSGHTVVPFGAAAGGHAWLHPECWRNWRQHRKAKAQEALEALGIRSSSAT